MEAKPYRTADNALLLLVRSSSLCYCSSEKRVPPHLDSPAQPRSNGSQRSSAFARRSTLTAPSPWHPSSSHEDPIKSLACFPFYLLPKCRFGRYSAVCSSPLQACRIQNSFCVFSTVKIVGQPASKYGVEFQNARQPHSPYPALSFILVCVLENFTQTPATRASSWCSAA